LFLLLWVYLPVLWGAPWVPGSMRVIRRMLELAEVKPGQMVVDLGAGDGRIVIIAARSFRAKAAGVEIDPLRWALANLGIRILGLRDRAVVRLGNMRSFPLEGADVVTLYLLKGIKQELQDRLQKSLRPGARVVSHTFSMSGWTPTVLDERLGIFVYEIGRTGEETQTRICA
jgi:cyclopropane fatty-acyl-phospholipid synthase-like methyltransferase